MKLLTALPHLGAFCNHFHQRLGDWYFRSSDKSIKPTISGIQIGHIHNKKASCSHHGTYLAMAYHRHGNQPIMARRFKTLTYQNHQISGIIKTHQIESKSKSSKSNVTGHRHLISSAHAGTKVYHKHPPDLHHQTPKPAIQRKSPNLSKIHKIHKIDKIPKSSLSLPPLTHSTAFHRPAFAQLSTPTTPSLWRL